MRVGPALLAVGLLLLIPATAEAQAIRAAALPPQIKTGGNTPELRDKFHEAVLRGLAGITGPSGPTGELGEVLSGADTRAKLGEDLLSCSGQASCLQRALSALKVNRLFTTELSVAGKSYTISMRLFDGQGHELTHAEDLCEICTVREADEAIAKTATRLAAVARSLPLEAAPVDNKPKEAAKPPKEEPPPPTSKASPMEAPPTAAASPPPVAPSERRRKVPWRILGFSSFGLGLVGLAIGIPLLVIDGRPTCDAPDPTRSCPDVYNTAAGGATMVAIGAIGLLASVPLLYLDYRDRHQVVSSLRLRSTPLRGGGGMVLEASF